MINFNLLNYISHFIRIQCLFDSNLNLHNQLHTTVFYSCVTAIFFFNLTI